MVNVHIYLIVVQGATTMSIDLTFCHEDSFCICLKTPKFEFTCLTWFEDEASIMTKHHSLK